MVNNATAFPVRIVNCGFTYHRNIFVEIQENYLPTSEPIPAKPMLLAILDVPCKHIVVFAELWVWNNLRNIRKISSVNAEVF